MAKKLTQEEFLAKAVAVHGVGRYDYSQVVYTSSCHKVIIRCPKHGRFNQEASSHLQGHGCFKCQGENSAARQRRTNEDFLTKARAIHGERYDYSQLVCQHKDKKAIIICPVHGRFEQSPGSHLQGHGCAQCATERQFSTTNLFIERAQAKHGSRYDYSLVRYQRSCTKVVIICPVHGEFSQNPGNHLRTSGCSKCGKAAMAEGNKKPVAELISKLQEVYGDKYDYSLVEQGASMIRLICSIHGEFAVWPQKIKEGKGCRKCDWQKARYLPKFAKTHGSKYDYSLVPTYFSSLDKIPIICPEHGQFLQQPVVHVRGGICPLCVDRSGFRRSEWVAIQKGREAVLYIILCKNDLEVFYKVGITYAGVSKRFRVRSAMPYDFVTVATYKNSDAGLIYDLEQRIHRQFKGLRYQPTIPFGGQTECYLSVAEILKLIPTSAVLPK